MGNVFRTLLNALFSKKLEVVLVGLENRLLLLPLLELILIAEKQHCFKFSLMEGLQKLHPPLA
jgi:hypothetical protein